MPDAIKRLTPNRWTAFTERELGALLGALEAADREGSIDDVGKALWASLSEVVDGAPGFPGDGPAS